MALQSNSSTAHHRRFNAAPVGHRHALGRARRAGGEQRVHRIVRVQRPQSLGVADRVSRDVHRSTSIHRQYVRSALRGGDRHRVIAIDDQDDPRIDGVKHGADSLNRRLGVPPVRRCPPAATTACTATNISTERGAHRHRDVGATPSPINSRPSTATRAANSP